MLRLRAGITFTELIIVFGMVLILMGFISLRVVPSQRRTSLAEIVAVLGADMRQQQLKAMQGASSSGYGSAWGIYFYPDRYVLFKGNSYQLNDPDNYTVNLDPGFSFFPINFPGSVLVYSRGSGEILNFTNPSYDLVITDDQAGSALTVTVNRYGAITQIN